MGTPRALGEIGGAVREDWGAQHADGSQNESSRALDAGNPLPPRDGGIILRHSTTDERRLFAVE